MSDNKNTSRGGIGFWGLLQLAFIVLKLCKVITWSWWLVLLPFWVGLILVLGLIAFICWINR